MRYWSIFEKCDRLFQFTEKSDRETARGARSHSGDKVVRNETIILKLGALFISESRVRFLSLLNASTTTLLALGKPIGFKWICRLGGKKMSIKLDSGFEIVRFSDLSYEEITVEIQYQGEQIAQINKDKGIDQLEIEILTDYTKSGFSAKFKLRDFQQALQEAQKLIKQ